MMNVLIIDPSGTTNYSNGLAKGLSSLCKLTVVVRVGFNGDNNKYEIKEYFRICENGTALRIVKGIHYIIGWLKTIRLVRKSRFNVIHIQWLLMYRLDIIFLKILSKYCNNIIYTAHNVIPHVAGSRKYNQLVAIYKLASKIIVHGRSSKDELCKLFPMINIEKIFIQYHGIDIREIGDTDDSKIPDQIKTKIKSCQNKIILFLGVIFNNKGVDRLLKFWIENKECTNNSLLIIAGLISEVNEEFKKYIDKISDKENILYLPGCIDKNLHDYLYTNSTIVVLPYRHASMSGVVFDAALFSKPILTTNVGCIPEYIDPNTDSFMVNNDYKHIKEALTQIIQSISSKELEARGIMLHKNIYSKFNWDTISQKLVEQIYQ